VVIDKRSKGEANVQGSSSDDGNLSLIISSRHIDIFYFERTDDMVCYTATILFFTIINP
jgi:hypothetical protein